MDQFEVGPFLVQFMHYVRPDRETGFTGTVCYISYDNEAYATGFTRRMPEDNYNAGIGRILSLDRALKELSTVIEGDFSIFWRNYRSSYKDLYLVEENKDLQRYMQWGNY